MRRATLDELAGDPAGRWVGGETFAHFCAAPTLWGVILWGRPDERQALELGRSLVLELRPPAARHASIVDASRLEGSDPAAFRAAERYLEAFGETLKTWVSRLALVRPSGMRGALVAGAYEVLPRPYPVAVFSQAGDAFAWLRTKSDEAPGGPADGTTGWPADGPALIASIHAEASGTQPIVGALRALLDTRLSGLGVAGAARALGLSERSLQRKLTDAGTTFNDELADARVRAAKRLLVDSDAPLTSIAFDVGCATLQHFSALFRKRTRESPSAFRKRARSAPTRR
jgi:AraC-like DNA-binding protein